MTITHWDGDVMTVEVPTQDGRTCVIEFRADYEAQKWHVQISDSCMRTDPEAVATAIGSALQTMADKVQRIDGAA